MGTVVCSTWVKALNGTWLPLVNTSEDADIPPPNGPLDDPPTAAPSACPPVACATDWLDGPKPTVLVEPPDTTPEPPVVPADDRMNKFRKSTGLFWKPGFTSSTT